MRSLPGGLRHKVLKLRRRLAPLDLDQVIRDLCAWRPLRLRDLAAILDRSPVYLQNTSLKRLLHEDRLRFLHPSQPNHPHQAYVAGARPSQRPESLVTSQTSPPPVREEPPPVDIGTND